jgi:hypothetical protein
MRKYAYTSGKSNTGDQLLRHGNFGKNTLKNKAVKG